MRIVRKEQPALYEPLDESFLSIPPYAEDAEQRARKQLEGRTYPREVLSDLLTAFNREIDNDETALHNCSRLQKDTSVCIVTGQQLGLMGGPIYTILKAISCVMMAREMDAIPVFWAASEDHDVDEIDHTYLLDSLGNLQKYHLALPKNGRFVESLELTAEHLKTINRFRESLGQPLLPEKWVGKSFVKGMLSLMTELFKGTGLVFLEPYVLRPLAKSFFLREIEECDRIQEVFAKSSEKLEEAPLPVGQGSHLFLKVAKKYRRKLHRTADGFQVGQEYYTFDEMRQMVEKEPERFSTSAAARPILQSLLIPTLAYVAGPTEIAYYCQLGAYHELHGASMPWVVPRISATFIPPFARQLLDQCKLEPWNEIPVHWEDLFSEMTEGVEELEAEWLQSAEKHFRADLSEKAMQSFTRHAAKGVKKKIIRARLKKMGIPPNALHVLRNLLHPHETLQERVLNWYGFQAEAKENLVEELLKEADWKTKGHLYCYYE